MGTESQASEGKILMNNNLYLRPYSRLYKYFHKRINKQITSNILPYILTSSKVLEIGYGHGYFENALKSKINCTYVSQDYSNEKANVNLKLPDIAKTFPTWDIIYSAHTFEHITPEQQSIAWQNVYNALAEDGYFILIVPDIIGYGLSFWECDITHQTPFSSRTIESLAYLTGFKVVEIKTCNDIGFDWWSRVLSFIYSLLPKGILPRRIRRACLALCRCSFAIMKKNKF